MLAEGQETKQKIYCDRRKHKAQKVKHLANCQQACRKQANKTTRNMHCLPGPRRMTFGSRPLYRAKNLQHTNKLDSSA